MKYTPPLELDEFDSNILVILAEKGSLTAEEIFGILNRQISPLDSQISIIHRLIDMVEKGYLDLESSKNATNYYSIKK